jgi:transposase InsO family protein
MIVPGKRGAKATWPWPRAMKSVMKKLPPPKLRARPAKRPPPVWVLISTESFIQHMQLVWLVHHIDAATSLAGARAFSRADLL